MSTEGHRDNHPAEASKDVPSVPAAATGFSLISTHCVIWRERTMFEGCNNVGSLGKPREKTLMHLLRDLTAKMGILLRI